MFVMLKLLFAVALVHQAFSVNEVLAMPPTIVNADIKFQQHEYRLIHEKIVIDDYNPDYIENPVITLFKYNDTSVAFNSTTTIKRELSNDIWSHIKILQSEDGTEYHAYPGKFSINICEAQKKDTFGTREIMQYGNITECPFQPGTYYVANYRPDETKFPAFIPRGRLIVKGKVYDGEIYLGSGRWYGIVEPVQV